MGSFLQRVRENSHEIVFVKGDEEHDPDPAEEPEELEEALAAGGAPVTRVAGS